MHVVSIGTVYIGTEFFQDPIEEYPEASILRVCRQIHAEICLLAYAVNVFWFYDYPPLRTWLKRRLPAQKAAVRRIQIFCSDCVKSPLRSFPRLQSVGVVCICDGTCPVDPEKGRVVKDALEGIWGRDGLEIRIVHG